MNAYKVDAVVTENGLVILEGLPLPIGAAVEVIVLDNRITDLSAAGLNAALIVRMKLFTLDYSLILRRICHLREADTGVVMTSIEQLFNFTLD